MRLLKVLLFLIIFSLILGELARVSIGEVGLAFNLIDFLVILSFLVWLFVVMNKKKKIFLPPGFIYIFIFYLIALVSLVNSLKFYPLREVLVGSMFLFRFIIYSLIYLVVYNIFVKREATFWVNILISASLVIAFLGILQIIFVPDLRFLNVYGWDPHVRRLVSTFLDPNFVGGFLTLTFILLLSKIIFKKSNNIGNWFAVLILLTSIFLTFSRSTYLMLAVALLLIGILKSKKIFLSLLVVMLIFIIFVPKARDRVIGGFTVDVTAQARIESWQNALKIAEDHPFLGVGFNNFRFAQSDYGFFNYPQTGDEHSGAGSDSSFLTILATSGILGSVVFIIILAVILYKSFLLRKQFLAFAAFVSFTSIIIHSQFVNSLLFPLNMIWLWFLAGLAFLESKDEENNT